jgi:hypothetical protein
MTFSIAPIQRWIWRDSERRVQKLLRFAARNRIARGEGKPETFTFLGLPATVGNATRAEPSPVLGPQPLC